MKIKHISTLNIWLVSRGNRLLYQGKKNPWSESIVLENALKEEGIEL